MSSLNATYHFRSNFQCRRRIWLLFVNVVDKKILNNFFLKVEFFYAINAGHFDALFNAVCEYLLTLAISITILEIFF